MTEQIRLERKELLTKCPHSPKKDVTNIELIFTPSPVDNVVLVNSLNSYIDEFIVKKEIAMEMIPIKILSHIIEECTNLPKRDAVPEKIKINSKSLKEDGSWGMHIDIYFKRNLS